MVSSTISNPQEAASATITLRIPSDKLDEALTYFRNLSIKVVSENLEGQDVTDQYVDIEARIGQYQKTIAKFQEILNRASEISDITNVNQQIINLQSQIDALRGQQKSLEQNAHLAKVTIYLSTDELALPYAPSEPFRPSVIFKLAVRSLMSNLQQLGALLIWLGVYAVIWLPTLVIAVFIYRRLHKTI